MLNVFALWCYTSRQTFLGMVHYIVPLAWIDCHLCVHRWTPLHQMRAQCAWHVPLACTNWTPTYIYIYNDKDVPLMFVGMQILNFGSLSVISYTYDALNEISFNFNNTSLIYMSNTIYKTFKRNFWWLIHKIIYFALHTQWMNKIICFFFLWNDVLNIIFYTCFDMQTIPTFFFFLKLIILNY